MKKRSLRGWEMRAAFAFQWRHGGFGANAGTDAPDAPRREFASRRAEAFQHALYDDDAVYSVSANFRRPQPAVRETPWRGLSVQLRASPYRSKAGADRLKTKCFRVLGAGQAIHRHPCPPWPKPRGAPSPALSPHALFFWTLEYMSGPSNAPGDRPPPGRDVGLKRLICLWTS